MNEIIKSIEAEQLKQEVPEFHVGDTVKVKSLGKIAKVVDIQGNKCVIESNNNTMKISLNFICRFLLN